MATPAPTEPMSAPQSAALADFARTCKAAARSVSLYPATHPAIQASLGRVVNASHRLTQEGAARTTARRIALVTDARSPRTPDPPMGELATIPPVGPGARSPSRRVRDATAWP